MTFDSRVFQLAKDVEHPEQNEDACAVDAGRGIAVVADGVASAIFSRQWAAILAEAVLAEPPDPDDRPAFDRWLATRRQSWSAQIDTGPLAWFQKAKLPAGAFSTLLWVRVEPLAHPPEGAFGACRLQGYAIGDSCLLHVRRGELVRTFPMETAEAFQADPLVVGSVDRGRDELIRFERLNELCYPDDTLVLCTDAIAEWALGEIESGNPPAWNDYWSLTEAQWRDEIVRLRQGREMCYDDATLLLLRVAAEEVEPAPATGQPTPPDVPHEDWKEKFKVAGEQLGEGVGLASQELVRGLAKWKDKALKKYREKFKRRDDP